MTNRDPNDVMRQLVANVLRNFHRNSSHPEADSEDIRQAVAAVMRIPYDPLLTRADPTCLYRIEPHDTLFDMREFLRELPQERYDDALYIRVSRAMYAERSKPDPDPYDLTDTMTSAMLAEVERGRGQGSMTDMMRRVWLAAVRAR